MKPGTQTVSGIFAGYRVARGHYEVRHVPTQRVVFTLTSWDQVLDQINRGDAELHRAFLAISTLQREPIEPCYPPPHLLRIFWEMYWPTPQVLWMFTSALLLGYALGATVGWR